LDADVRETPVCPFWLAEGADIAPVLQFPNTKRLEIRITINRRDMGTSAQYVCLKGYACGLWHETQQQIVGRCFLASFIDRRLSLQIGNFD
jgi:hypothetical protein